jgi:Na+/melibiose symporter-like transporter
MPLLVQFGVYPVIFAAAALFALAFFIDFLTSIYLLSRLKKKQAPLALNFPLHIVGSALGLLITSKTPLWFYFLTQALSGYGASCIQFIPTTLLADLPDVDEVVTGKEREGVSAGFVSRRSSSMSVKGSSGGRFT